MADCRAGVRLALLELLGRDAFVFGDVDSSFSVGCLGMASRKQGMCRNLQNDLPKVLATTVCTASLAAFACELLARFVLALANPPAVRYAWSHA
jgi:hypothetical protein